MSNSSKRFTALHVETEGSRQDLEDSFRLRFEIFCRKECFIAPDNHPDGRECDRFDELSEHIIVRECESRKLAGAVRLVRYSHELGFPTARHFSHLYKKLVDLPINRIAEISRLCISPRHRHRLVQKDELLGGAGCTEHACETGPSNGSSHRRGYPIILLSLVKKIYHVAVSLGVDYMIASMEDGLLRYLSLWGMEPERLADAYIDFYGHVMPCIIDVDRARARMCEKRPEIYKFLVSDDDERIIGSLATAGYTRNVLAQPARHDAGEAKAPRNVSHCS